MTQQLNPAKFVAKWKPVKLSERAASQSHFNDLCELLGQPSPTDHDATGAEYTFEKCVVPMVGASRGALGERGFVDVWWRGKFAWEYKRKGKYRDLVEAYRQLCQYREALENPPLLIVSDIARTEIHTNFTGTAKQIHAVTLDELADARGLGLLRRVFTDPLSFKPQKTTEAVTKHIAEQFATIARSLRQFGHDPNTAAHFLMKCMFCLFAEDVELLPKELFKKLIQRYKSEPAKLTERLTELFGKMRTGGDFGTEPIAHFNGGLFDEAPALKLTPNDIGSLMLAAQSDWGAVEPAIFGTLFERSLDPNTRAQIGAHYTSRDDIMLVVEPVVMAPLRREWEAVKADVEAQLDRRRKGKADTKKRADKAIEKTLRDFVDRLASIRILDPACGSGNFLYVAIQQLLHLEKEVITFAARPDIALGLFPQVRPTQLHGIEINPYAAELAQVVIWIGYLQWMRDNGFAAPRDPILEPLQTIECRDAILEFSPSPLGEGRGEGRSPSPSKGEGRGEGSKRITKGEGKGEGVKQLAKPASWPEADFIIGNPPFLGSKLFRQQGLSDEYLDAMYSTFDLPKTSDLCCYWFELARQAIEENGNLRAGLLATQGIRGGDNRTVLERIKRTGDIFSAWSDREWILDGAAVNVSIIAFGRKTTEAKALDGQAVPEINPNLTADVETTGASELESNRGVSFMGDTKGGPFDIDWKPARTMISQPNPTSRVNTSVVFPWVNGADITKRPRGMWIVDFGNGTSKAEAAQFEAPFRFVEDTVKPERVKIRQQVEASEWWLHVRPRIEMREALAPLSRFLFTTNTAKYRLFVWVLNPTLPDHAGIVFARSDDYFLECCKAPFMSCGRYGWEHS